MDCGGTKVNEKTTTVENRMAMRIASEKLDHMLLVWLPQEMMFAQNGAENRAGWQQMALSSVNVSNFDCDIAHHLQTSKVGLP